MDPAARSEASSTPRALPAGSAKPAPRAAKRGQAPAGKGAAPAQTFDPLDVLTRTRTMPDEWLRIDPGERNKRLFAAGIRSSKAMDAARDAVNSVLAAAAKNGAFAGVRPAAQAAATSSVPPFDPASMAAPPVVTGDPYDGPVPPAIADLPMHPGDASIAPACRVGDAGCLIPASLRTMPAGATTPSKPVPPWAVGLALGAIGAGVWWAVTAKKSPARHNPRRRRARRHPR